MSGAVLPGSFAAPNATASLRVMYFPKAPHAKIKDPQASTLSVAFDGPHFAHNSAVIPFTRKDDRCGAAVPIERHLYAIFYVKDELTNAIDDNSGKLWDVLFCEPNGERSVSSLMAQAETYAGNRWPEKVHRPQDYAKAVSIVQSAAAGETWKNFTEPMVQLWHYEVLRDGNGSEAWTKVAKEIDQFVADHPNDQAAAIAVGAFITRYEDRFSKDFVDRILDAFDPVVDRRHSIRSEVELALIVYRPRIQAAIASASYGGLDR